MASRDSCSQHAALYGGHKKGAHGSPKEARKRRPSGTTQEPAPHQRGRARRSGKAQHAATQHSGQRALARGAGTHAPERVGSRAARGVATSASAAPCTATRSPSDRHSSMRLSTAPGRGSSQTAAQGPQHRSPALQECSSAPLPGCRAAAAASQSATTTVCPPTQSQTQAPSLGAHCHGSGCNTSWSRPQLACDPPPLPGLRATSRCEQTVASPYRAQSAPTKLEAGRKVGAHFCLSSQGASHSTRLPTSKAACTRAARHSSGQASHAHVGALCRRPARQACNAPHRRPVAGDRRHRPARHCATAPQQPCLAQCLPQRSARARAGLTSQRLWSSHELFVRKYERARAAGPPIWAFGLPHKASLGPAGPAAAVG